MTSTNIIKIKGIDFKKKYDPNNFIIPWKKEYSSGLILKNIKECIYFYNKYNPDSYNDFEEKYCTIYIPDNASIEIEEIKIKKSEHMYIYKVNSLKTDIIIIKKEKLISDIDYFSDVEKCLKLVYDCPCLIRYIKKENIGDKYIDICYKALSRGGTCLQYINVDNIDNYEKVIYEKVAEEYHSGFKYINPKSCKNYESLCYKLIANLHNLTYMQDINMNYVSNRKLFYEFAFSKSWEVIKYIDPNNILDNVLDFYDNMCWTVVKKHITAIYFVNPDKVKNYDSLCYLALMNHPAMVFTYMSLDKIKDIQKLMKLIISKNKRICGNFIPINGMISGPISGSGAKVILSYIFEDPSKN